MCPGEMRKYHVKYLKEEPFVEFLTHNTKATFTAGKHRNKIFKGKFYSTRKVFEIYFVRTMFLFI